MLHKYSSPANNHVVQSWNVADSAGLSALAGLTTDDIGRLAYQEDTQEFHALISISPVEWKAALGTPGPAGDSAYDLAVANGFVGDEAAWLLSLEGADGADGADGAAGASAYEIALAEGFVGTEAAWLLSLKGDPGADGLDGAPGDDGLGVPAGGTTGQVLTKASAADNDTVWTTPSTGGSGGVGYFEGETTPVGAVAGDTWYKPSDGVKYTYITDGGSLVWAQV